MLELFQTYSYLGLFIILFIEEAGVFLPIPGDLFIAAVSALPDSNYFLVVATSTMATLCGSTILFYLSKRYAMTLVIKYGSKVKINENKIKSIQKWFTKYGGLAIVIGRLIPGLRTVTPIAAGAFGLSYKTFWTYTALASFIWANAYYLIGKFFSGLLSTIN